MSVADIIEELPKLTPEQRSVVSRKLHELEELDESLFLHEGADAMFQRMDSDEQNHANRETR